jgi:hypothetical protein
MSDGRKNVGAPTFSAGAEDADAGNEKLKDHSRLRTIVPLQRCSSGSVQSGGKPPHSKKVGVPTF